LGAGCCLGQPPSYYVSEPTARCLAHDRRITKHDPLVQVSGTQVQTTNGGPATPLPNQPPIQIYTVSVGTSMGIDPVILQSIATAANGYYLNSEVSSDALATFFVQISKTQ